MAVPTVDSITNPGFKSLYGETRMEFRPLTILAGRNNSGNSSAIQPLLLLKQTLEWSSDPGPKVVDGHRNEVLVGSRNEVVLRL